LKSFDEIRDVNGGSLILMLHFVKSGSNLQLYVCILKVNNEEKSNNCSKKYNSESFVGRALLRRNDKTSDIKIWNDNTDQMTKSWQYTVPIDFDHGTKESVGKTTVSPHICEYIYIHI
jgi:hypothetical protein